VFPAIVSKPSASYIHIMSRSASQPSFPDLFDSVPVAQSRQVERVRSRVPLPAPDLSTLSDLRLAWLLVEATRELKLRTGGRLKSESQTALELSLREAVRTLVAMIPKREKRATRSKSADTTMPLQEAKRKAIRTALQAGVSPAQVAKHFGLPLSAVRQALSRTE
jgi:DNA-directed RNA polymerase specialized sigma24 family protein